MAAFKDKTPAIHRNKKLKIKEIKEERAVKRQDGHKRHKRQRVG